MTVSDFLARLDGVRPRGTGKWSARCIAHADKSPSLSVREGDRGILIRCFAGCSTEEICGALGIKQRDLFYDSTIDPRIRRETLVRRDQKEQIRKANGLTADALREADHFVHSRRGFDISRWSNQQLDDELKALAAAYRILDSEGLDE